MSDTYNASIEVVHTCMKLIDETATKEEIRGLVEGENVKTNIYKTSIIKGFYDIFDTYVYCNRGAENLYELLEDICCMFGERTGFDKEIYLGEDGSNTQYFISGLMLSAEYSFEHVIDLVAAIYTLIVGRELAREYSPAIAYLFAVIIIYQSMNEILVLSDAATDALVSLWMTDSEELTQENIAIAFSESMAEEE